MVRIYVLAGRTDQILGKFFRIFPKEILKYFLRNLFRVGVSSILKTVSVDINLQCELCPTILSNFPKNILSSVRNNLLVFLVVANKIDRTAFSRLVQTGPDHVVA